MDSLVAVLLGVGAMKGNTVHAALFFTLNLELVVIASKENQVGGKTHLVTFGIFIHNHLDKYLLVTH